MSLNVSWENFWVQKTSPTYFLQKCKTKAKCQHGIWSYLATLHLCKNPPRVEFSHFLTARATRHPEIGWNAVLDRPATSLDLKIMGLPFFVRNTQEEWHGFTNISGKTLEVEKKTETKMNKNKLWYAAVTLQTLQFVRLPKLPNVHIIRPNTYI